MLWLLARNHEATEAAEIAARWYQATGDFEAEMRVTAQIGWTLFEQMKRPEGIARLLPVLQRWELDPMPTEGAAQLHIALANLYWIMQSLGDDMEKALVLVDRGSSLASQVGDRRLLARAQGRLGTILLTLGRLEEALEALDRAAELAATESDLESLARALNNRSLAHFQLGESAKSLQDMEDQLEITRQLGNPASIAFCLGNLAAYAEQYGDWERARLLYDECLLVGRQVYQARSGSFMSRALYHRVLAGDSGAEEELEAFAAEAQRSGDEAASANALMWLSEADLSAGRAEKARDQLLIAFASPALEARERYRFVLARTYVALGDAAQAEIILDAAIEKLRQQRDPQYLATNLAARGTAFASDGRWDEAKNDFEEALAMMVKGGQVREEAGALADYGLMLQAKGDLPAARDKLEQALKLFERMGAKPAAERTRRSLADLR